MAICGQKRAVSATEEHSGSMWLDQAGLILLSCLVGGSGNHFRHAGMRLIDRIHGYWRKGDDGYLTRYCRCLATFQRLPSWAK